MPIREKLRPDAMVLLRNRREMPEWAGLAVRLDAGLHNRAKRQPAFNSVEEIRPALRVVADVLFKKQVDGVDGAGDFLADDRTKCRFVGGVTHHRLARLEKE